MNSCYNEYPLVKINPSYAYNVTGFSKRGFIYHIASNYGPDVYFFPAIFNQATKQDRRLLWEETRAVYNL